MIYKYSPQQFWNSVEQIKGIKNSLDKYPLEERKALMALLYKAMEATRNACIATVDEKITQNNFCERDKETDREFLVQVIGSFEEEV